MSEIQGYLVYSEAGSEARRTGGDTAKPGGVIKVQLWSYRFSP